MAVIKSSLQLTQHFHKGEKKSSRKTAREKTVDNTRTLNPGPDLFWTCVERRGAGEGRQKVEIARGVALTQRGLLVAGALDFYEAFSRTLSSPARARRGRSNLARQLGRDSTIFYFFLSSPFNVHGDVRSQSFPAERLPPPRRTRTARRKGPRGIPARAARARNIRKGTIKGNNAESDKTTLAAREKL